MVDIYSTMRRSGKYLPCRLFLYVTHIGAFVPMKKREIQKKSKQISIISLQKIKKGRDELQLKF